MLRRSNFINAQPETGRAANKHDRSEDGQRKVERCETHTHIVFWFAPSLFFPLFSFFLRLILGVKGGQVAAADHHRPGQRPPPQIRPARVVPSRSVIRTVAIVAVVATTTTAAAVAVANRVVIDQRSRIVLREYPSTSDG